MRIKHMSTYCYFSRYSQYIPIKLVNAVRDLQIDCQQVIGTVETISGSGTQSIHINHKSSSPFPLKVYSGHSTMHAHSSQLLSKHEQKQKLIDVMMPATWIGQGRDMIKPLKPIKHTSLNTQMWILCLTTTLHQTCHFVILPHWGSNSFFVSTCWMAFLLAR